METVTEEPSIAQDITTVFDRMRAGPQRSAEEIRQWEWKNNVVPNLSAAGLPSRFWYEVKDWHPKQKAVFDKTKELCCGTGAVVALIGDRGLGKTTIAAQLIIERAWHSVAWHRRPPYRKLADLIALFKPLYADFGSIGVELLIERRNEFCSTHPLIVIDELHECDDQKLKDRVLTDLIDRRYASKTDTVLISNQDPKSFQETTNDSVLSRLSEHGRIIHCQWKGFR